MMKIYCIFALCCVSTVALRLLPHEFEAYDPNEVLEGSEASRIPVETGSELLDPKTSVDALRFVPAVKPFVDDPRFPEENQGENFQEEPNGNDVTGSDFMPFRGPRGGLQWRDRLLVWPEKKFAFCWIDKNAGTQFNLLINHLNQKEGKWWESSWTNTFNVSWEDITKANGWRFGIFLRDPAERFLSAWASKCQQMENRGTNCLGQRNAPKDTNRMSDARDVFQQAASYLPAYIDHFKEKGWWNSHYDPQNTFCGARELTDYDFVGHLSGDYEKVHTQIQDMFKRVAQVPRNHPSFWSFVNKTFSTHSVQGHHTDSFHKLEFFYQSPKIYQIVTNAYEDDYNKLNMERGHYESL